MTSSIGLKSEVSLDEKKAVLRAQGAQVCEECGIVSWLPWAMVGKSGEEICGRCFGLIMGECARIAAAPIPPTDKSAGILGGAL